MYVDTKLSSMPASVLGNSAMSTEKMVAMKERGSLKRDSYISGSSEPTLSSAQPTYENDRDNCEHHECCALFCRFLC